MNSVNSTNTRKTVPKPVCCEPKKFCNSGTTSNDDWPKDDADSFGKASEDSKELLLTSSIYGFDTEGVKMPNQTFYQKNTRNEDGVKNKEKITLADDAEEPKENFVPFLFLAILILSIAAVVLLSVVIILLLKIKSISQISSLKCSVAAKNNRDFNEAEIYNSLVYQNLEKQKLISQYLFDCFESQNIRSNLRWLSKHVHVAGSVENLELMNRLARQYRNYGYSVRTYEYSVLLSYPNYKQPNTVHWRNEKGSWEIISNGLGERRGPAEAISQQNDYRTLIYWSAYSKNGTVEGEVVYANYCTTDDFDELSQIDVLLRGKIVLCRYGKLFRGQLVYLAERFGAVGVILYSDPNDYAPGKTLNETFPHQIWLPDSGAQTGTLLRTDGDPETPGFPSKDYIYRSESESSIRASGIMPNILVMPIGYRDALKIMQKLNGPFVKLRWKGGMNVTYRYNGSAIFRLSVRSTTTRRKIKNVIATLRGTVEPDRYVLLSNHVDAWIQGAIDPGTGTATMLEMARVLSKVVKETGWQPRRSIVFCQWDAEEYGLIGSTEFVEEFIKPLQQRAVALINVDNINGNTTLSVKGVPLLYRVIVDSAAKVPSPSEVEQSAGRKTILDSWKHHAPGATILGDKSVPRINIPGSGSDYQRFLTYLGIPVADLRFESVPLYTYMLYHSMYEIPWTVENLIDRNFSATAAVGKLWLELGKTLADSLVIPFNVYDYAVMIADYIENLNAHLYEVGIASDIGSLTYHVFFKNLRDASKRFNEIAYSVQNFIKLANSNEMPLTRKQVEMLNNRLQNLEKSFISEDGIYPERSNFRHVIFSNSASNKYAGLLLAGIIEPAEKYRKAIFSENPNAKKYWLHVVKIGFNKLQHAIESAILTLTLDGFHNHSTFF